MTAPDRFWAKVDRRGPDECWPWLGWRSLSGYGQHWSDGRRVPAHRLALALSGVAVPPDKFVLHSCDNPPCVNPAHLRVGTTSDNALDMYARGRRVQDRKTHCIHGHPFAGTNLVIEANTGRHRCRTCIRARNRVSTPRWRARLLRSSRDGSTPVPTAPQPGLGSLEPSLDSPRGASPVQDTGQ